MAKRKAKTRRVMVRTPAGKRRSWTVPVANFKGTVTVLKRFGYRVLT
jgi:hypothetical protein